MKKNIFRRIASLLGSVLFLGTLAACNDVETPEDTETKKELAVVEGEYLYRGGISGYTVVLRDDANFYEELAASELSQNLAKAVYHTFLHLGSVLYYIR